MPPAVPEEFSRSGARVERPHDDTFLSGLRSLVGKRVRIWYDIELSESGAPRETVEGRLTSVKSEAVLVNSRLVHPTTLDDHATRTAPVRSIRGYNRLDQVTGAITSTVVRPKQGAP